MKRFLFAAVFALIFHGALLGLKIDWLQADRQPILKPEPLSVTLSYRYPEKPVKPKPLVPQITKIVPDKKTDRKTIKEPVKKIIKKASVIVKAPEPIETALEEAPMVQPPLPEQEDPVVHEQESEIISFSRSQSAKENIQDIKISDTVTEIKIELSPSPPLPQPLKNAYPEYNSNPAPRYPGVAKRRGYEGVVILDVYVDRTGKVAEMSISKSSGHKILDNAAINSVKNWLFKPGKRGDETIEMWIKVPVRFELK